MSIVGKSVYLCLYEAVRKLESDSRKYSAELSSLESQFQHMAEKREELFSSLAQEYLPEMDVESIRGSLREVQYDLHRIYEEKELHRQGLEAEAKEIIDEKHELETSYNELTESLNSLAEKRLALEAKVSTKLKTDTEFLQYCKAASTIGERVKQNSLRVDEVKKEAEEKLPDFESDRLFSYLLEQKFATPRYKGKGLKKRLDSWVAGQVSFSKQYRNYNFLRTTPEIMQLEVENQEKQLAAALESIESSEEKIAKKVGLTKVREEGEKIGGERDSVMLKLEENDRKYGEVVAAREDLENDRGRYYQEALKRLKDFLESQPLVKLRNQAVEQPGQTDDILVSQIDSVSRNIDDLRDQARLRERQRSLTENQIEGLGRICAKSRREDFDSARSFFNGDFRIDSLISAFIDGSLTEASLWSEMVQSQYFSQPARRYSPMFEHVSGGRVSNVFGRALVEMILNGQIGRPRGHSRRARSTRGLPGRSSTSRSVPRRSPLPNLGGGGFSSGSGF